MQSMKWLDSLEFEIKWRLREIILEHGAPLAVTDPKVKRLFDTLATVRRVKMEVPHIISLERPSHVVPNR